ncbi:MAG: hypothetical protein V3U92_18935 [Cellulophaga sp.]
MSSKYKVIFFNFIGFALFFLIFKYALTQFIELKSLYISIIAAIVASIIAPKFGVGKIEGKEKLLMKWVFLKGHKEF